MFLYSHASGQWTYAVDGNHRCSDANTLQPQLPTDRPIDRVKSGQNDNKTYAHRMTTCVMKMVAEGFINARYLSLAVL
jgi:hypothetical protein